VTPALARPGLGLALGLLALSAFAQEPSQAEREAASQEALLAKQAKISPKKQAFVEEQLALTPEELAKFRPIYAEHQQALRRFNQRRLDNVAAYSRDWNAQALTDAKVHDLALEALAIEREETFELEMVYGKVRTVLPPKKAAHYLQIESKLRTLVRYKQAESVPVLAKKPPAG
jgi:hypothetical protein